MWNARCVQSFKDAEIHEVMVRPSWEVLPLVSDQYIKIDGHMVCHDTVLTYPHFSITREKLYWVSRDAQTYSEKSQLFVPKLQ